MKNEEMKNENLEAEETVEEEEVIVKERKIKKAGKAILKFAKKAALPVATAVTGFAIGRVTKGAVNLPDEIQDAVETAVENVTE